jgi:hypothetical protein
VLTPEWSRHHRGIHQTRRRRCTLRRSRAQSGSTFPDQRRCAAVPGLDHGTRLLTDANGPQARAAILTFAVTV